MNALIIEDHPITAFGIELILKKTEKFDQIFKATCGADAVKVLEGNTVGFLVLDIHLPNTDSHGFVSKVVNQFPKIDILIHTASSEEVYGRKYLNSGVKGFLSKSSSDEDFMIAVNTILRGNIYITSGLLSSVIGGEKTSEPLNPFSRLSNRELEVLHQLLRGQSIKQICEIMNLQQSTVATQKMRIMSKLDVSSMIDVFHLANQYNLFDGID